MAVTSSISRDTEQFSSLDVTARITAILADAGYAVLRVRAGTIVFAARTEEACRAWLQDEDYRADRFLVQPGPMTPDDADELARLRAFERKAREVLGSASWEAFRKDWFTGDWARDEADNLVGLSAKDLGQWPLNCIDWEAAARQQRDNYYTAIAFDGEGYYGQET